MGLLDGDISELFGSVFGEFYLNGEIVTVSYTDDGYGGMTETTSKSNCKLQVDACTERQKLEDGYSARDVRILILQNSTCARPSLGNCVIAKGKTYIVGPIVTEDPAASYWECRGTPL